MGYDEVKEAADGVVSLKGAPCTQYNYETTKRRVRRDLKVEGATSCELWLFDKLVASAPVTGGGWKL